jgi:hypothetical protein
VGAWRPSLKGKKRRVLHARQRVAAIAGRAQAAAIADGNLRRAAAICGEEGDTLQSVAEKPDAQLATGQLLIVPDGVMSAHNTDDTFRPYHPNKAIGHVSPSAPEAPPPPKKHGGCGIIGKILLVAIAVRTTALSPAGRPEAGCDSSCAVPR